jgi:Protein of unknown function (DUF3891)
MIIRADGPSLLFITQPDHARLAADLLNHWKGFADHPRRAALLLAAREHDNGWHELDEELVFDPAEGRALDFITAPDRVKHQVWPRGVDRLAEASFYAAALVAQHAVFVYDSHRDEPEWTRFFAAMRSRRDDLRARSGHPPEDLDADYPYLAVVDLLSLTFCNGWHDDHERFATRTRCDDRGIVITPTPFTAPSVPLRVRARRLADRRYASAADLRAAFEAAPVAIVEGQARGADAA